MPTQQLFCFSLLPQESLPAILAAAANSGGEGLTTASTSSWSAMGGVAAGGVETTVERLPQFNIVQHLTRMDARERSHRERLQSGRSSRQPSARLTSGRQSGPSGRATITAGNERLTSGRQRLASGRERSRIPSGRAGPGAERGSVSTAYGGDAVHRGSPTKKIAPPPSSTHHYHDHVWGFSPDITEQRSSSSLSMSKPPRDSQLPSSDVADGFRMMLGLQSASPLPPTAPAGATREDYHSRFGAAGGGGGGADEVRIAPPVTTTPAPGVSETGVSIYAQPTGGRHDSARRQNIVAAAASRIRIKGAAPIPPAPMGTRPGAPPSTAAPPQTASGDPRDAVPLRSAMKKPHTAYGRDAQPTTDWSERVNHNTLVYQYRLRYTMPLYCTGALSRSVT